MPPQGAFTGIAMGLLLCPLAAAQTLPDTGSGPPLARISEIVRDNIDRLPNYTCTMTVERSERVVKTGRQLTSDRVRVEVAMVGDQELYAWPGSRSFRQRSIQDIVPTGTFSTGEFGIFLSSIFLSGTAEFDYKGVEDLNGRSVHHFVYKIPRERSKYTIIVPQGRGIVGYEGSVWCDAQSLDLVRLEVVMREIPPDLPVEGGRLVIDYGRVRVGRGDFLLPRFVDSTFAFNGLDGHNRTSFSGCREYAVESGISFGEIPTAEEPAAAQPLPVFIPGGIIIESKLETDLNPAHLATGDPFAAIVTKPVRHKNAVIVPKGARIHGHVAGVAPPEGIRTCVGVVLHPDWIEFAGREGAFTADQLVTVEPANVPRNMNQRCFLQPEPEFAIVLRDARRWESSVGYPIVWRTHKPSADE